MTTEDKEPKSVNKHDGVIPSFIQGIFAIIAACIGGVAIIYGAYITRAYTEFQTESTSVVGTITQNIANTGLAPTSTKLPSQTPLPTYTDQPTYTPPPTYTPFPTFTTIPTPDALFKDDFTDNHNGWDLSDSASMANGELTITANSKDQVWLTIPNFRVESENYFIQAKMYMGQTCDCYGGFGLGFGLGEKDISYHKFFFGNYTDGFLQLHTFISLQDNGKEIFGDEMDRVSFYKPHIISLEVKGEQATLSYDGNSIITKQITSHGKDIGLYVWNNENKNLVFSFDDLVIRELP